MLSIIIKMDINSVIGNIIYLLHIGISLFLIILIYVTNNKKNLFIILIIFIIVLVTWILFNTCIIQPIEYFFQKNQKEEYNYIFFLSYFNVKDNMQKKIIIISNLFLIYICMIKIYIEHIKINKIKNNL